MNGRCSAFDVRRVAKEALVTIGCTDAAGAAPPI
jgi:hypothetical protein